MLTIEARHRYTARTEGFSLDVNLVSPDTGVTGLFGRSGTGKTTLLKIVAGLLRADFVRISVGTTVLCDSESGIWIPPEKRRIGYVFQDTRLFPHLTVAGNLSFGQHFNPAPKINALEFDNVVDLLNLGGLLTRSVHGLSGGESQRVAIGRTLLTNPQLLLLDEPLAALDGDHKAEILPYLEGLRHNLELPILYVSHSLGEIRRLATWLAVMDHGQIKVFGSVEEVTGQMELEPIAEGGDAESVIEAEVCKHDEAFGLTYLSASGQTLLVTKIDLPAGAHIRVQVRPQDVALALEKPTNVSFLNILEGIVTSIRKPEWRPVVDLQINIGSLERPVYLWAQVTKLAAERLALQMGMSVYALIKAVSLNRERFGP